VLADGALRPATVHVRDGTIVALSSFDDLPSGVHLEDVGDAVLMSGLVDTHVHINDPGRADWEGFDTITRAAAAGGVTTLVDMPLNSIPATTCADALRLKTAAAAERCVVDVAFWGGAVPGNTSDLESLRDAGARGFKGFLCPSGVDEFPALSARDLRAAMREIAALGVPLLVHAELPDLLGAAPTEPRERRRYARYLASRPRQAELEAIRLVLHLCRELGTRVHIVHVSAADALSLLARARAERQPVTAETCPHYLHFAAEEVQDGHTELKCAPPVREGENRERLWQGLGDGLLDMVVTDHSPCPPAMKQREAGDFFSAWGGIASLQLTLPVTWTGARRRGFAIQDVARWMCEAPARLAGLDGRKGTIAAGRDADFVAWWPEQTLRVDPTRLEHRHKLTPYAGTELQGVVIATYLRGRKIYERGTLARGASGRVLIPNRS
jgi:allantoinase